MRSDSIKLREMKADRGMKKKRSDVNKVTFTPCDWEF